MRALLADLKWKRDLEKKDGYLSASVLLSDPKPYIEVELKDDDIESEENEAIIDDAITTFESKTKVFLDSEINIIIDEDEIEEYIVDADEKAKTKFVRNGIPDINDVQPYHRGNHLIDSMSHMTMNHMAQKMEHHDRDRVSAIRRKKIADIMRIHRIHPRDVVKSIDDAIPLFIDKLKHDIFVAIGGHLSPSSNASLNRNLDILAKELLSEIFDSEKIRNMMYY